MQRNQELDAVDYSILEPKNYPQFKQSQSIDYPVDWLNQDSIDSLAQGS